MALGAMLEARSVALVGASAKPGSLGERCLTELERSPGRPDVHLVNPRYAGSSIAGHEVVSSLDDLAEPVDLVVLAVGDAHLEAELQKAARRGDRSAVIFASAIDPQSSSDSSAFRARLGQIASDAGMALCGGGCMGFVSAKVRALGYLERSPLPPGPVALVTHSGSAFSALLRTDRAIGWSLAVSSGQELVTTTADYIDYALSLEETRVVALLIEALRSPEALRRALERARRQEVAVVALTVGTSKAGQAMVKAHSGALAGSDGAFEALFDAHGVLRVSDLGEMCDTLELLCAPRRARRRRGAPGGIGAVLDSGAERALVVDVASRVGVSFPEISPVTHKRLEELLDPGLEPMNPLDVWGTGRSTEELFCGALSALADDEAIDVVALAVDLVPEFDADESYRAAILAAHGSSDVPMCVLSHVPSAIDRTAAAALRSSGIPVLEGTTSGLAAIGHLLELRDFSERPPVVEPPLVPARRLAWRERLKSRQPLSPSEAFDMLADYGIASPPVRIASSLAEALEAAGQLGYPVALKTAEESVAHKSDAGGVFLAVSSAEALSEAYSRLETTIGPRAVVQAMATGGVEVSVGIVTDGALGPLVVVGAGGVLVELLADRAVALPPIDAPSAERLLDRLAVRRLLDGYRSGTGGALVPVYEAIVALSALATELGDLIAALDVNPLSCGPSGALALDVLVEIAGG